MSTPTTAADQAAISYVTGHYPGAGTASVLATSPDVEHGIAVYDVRIQAPSGTTYVVHVQQSNDSVLSVNLAEKQVTAPVTTPPVTTPPETTTPVTTTPPVTTPPETTTPVTTTPPVMPAREPVQPAEPRQASSTSGNSVDTEGPSTSGKSVDTHAPSSSPGTSPDHHNGSPDTAKPANQSKDG